LDSKLGSLVKTTNEDVVANVVKKDPELIVDVSLSEIKEEKMDNLVEERLLGPLPTNLDMMSSYGCVR
jgi:hypothetical protein